MGRNTWVGQDSIRLAAIDEAATSSKDWVAKTTATRRLRRVFSHWRILAAKAVSSRKSEASSSASSVGLPSIPRSNS
ncbi:hypothetical protein [uncultured Phenylobacterium sp.]|uniref:hypothetical protein n=1 Tax=uncultured Phenylobacterium sp. TaxID=349273 RepID=UPI0025F30392|nr:hypothetical protein [uncultured Phenylobacterium sp.]